MKKNKLGNTGLEVSCLGVGLSEIGYRVDRSREKQAAEVLNAALNGASIFWIRRPVTTSVKG